MVCGSSNAVSYFLKRALMFFRARKLLRPTIMHCATKRAIMKRSNVANMKLLMFARDSHCCMFQPGCYCSKSSAVTSLLDWTLCSAASTVNVNWELDVVRELTLLLLETRAGNLPDCTLLLNSSFGRETQTFQFSSVWPFEFRDNTLTLESSFASSSLSVLAFGELPM